MTPRTMAIAYRIWAYASAREWNCTAAEIAEGIGENPKSVGSVLKLKKWHERLRVPKGRVGNDLFALRSGNVPYKSGALGAETSATYSTIIPQLRRQIEAEAWD